MKVVFFCVFLSQLQSSIVVKRHSLLPVPESQKLQIQFSRGGHPIQIKGDQRIKKIESSNQYQVQTELKTFDRVYKSPISNVHDSNLMKPFEGVADVLYKNTETEPANPDLKVAVNQIKELEGNLEEIFAKTKGNSPVLMSKESLQTIASYLENLNYIRLHEEGKAEEAGKPPMMPDHLRKYSLEVIPNALPEITKEEPNVLEEAMAEVDTAKDLEEEAKQIELDKIKAQ